MVRWVKPWNGAQGISCLILNNNIEMKRIWGRSLSEWMIWFIIFGHSTAFPIIFQLQHWYTSRKSMGVVLTLAFPKHPSVGQQPKSASLCVTTYSFFLILSSASILSRLIYRCLDRSTCGHRATSIALHDCRSLYACSHFFLSPATYY